MKQGSACVNTFSECIRLTSFGHLNNLQDIMARSLPVNPLFNKSRCQFEQLQVSGVIGHRKIFPKPMKEWSA